MWTFFIALAILIGGYLIYSRISEKVFAADDRLTPAIDHPDGVDIHPLKKWKAFLIELLNIAGTGPIFGAISGALFGPIVFLCQGFTTIYRGVAIYYQALCQHAGDLSLFYLKCRFNIFHYN